MIASCILGFAQDERHQACPSSSLLLRFSYIFFLLLKYDSLRILSTKPVRSPSVFQGSIVHIYGPLPCLLEGGNNSEWYPPMSTTPGPSTIFSQAAAAWPHGQGIWASGQVALEKLKAWLQHSVMDAMDPAALNIQDLGSHQCCSVFVW